MPPHPHLRSARGHSNGYNELGYGPGGKKSSANPDKCMSLEGVKCYQVSLLGTLQPRCTRCGQVTLHVERVLAKLGCSACRWRGPSATRCAGHAAAELRTLRVQLPS